jgi:hypothetical protein
MGHWIDLMHRQNAYSSLTAIICFGHKVSWEVDCYWITTEKINNIPHWYNNFWYYLWNIDEGIKVCKPGGGNEIPRGGPSAYVPPEGKQGTAELSSGKNIVPNNIID